MVCAITHVNTVNARTVLLLLLLLLLLKSLIIASSLQHSTLFVSHVSQRIDPLQIGLRRKKCSFCYYLHAVFVQLLTFRSSLSCVCRVIYWCTGSRSNNRYNKFNVTAIIRLEMESDAEAAVIVIGKMALNKISNPVSHSLTVLGYITHNQRQREISFINKWWKWCNIYLLFAERSAQLSTTSLPCFSQNVISQLREKPSTKLAIWIAVNICFALEMHLVKFTLKINRSSIWPLIYVHSFPKYVIMP